MQNILLKKKYYTIGEVAEVLDLPDYVIRFWEKNFPIIKPQKTRGRRYYRKEDIDKLNLIKKMLYTDKMSIKAAQNILFLSSPRSNKAASPALKNTGNDTTYGDFSSNLDNLLDKLYITRNKLAQILEIKY